MNLGNSSAEKKSAEALEHIYADKSLLINEISKSNLPTFWTNMQQSGLIKKGAGSVGGENYNKLSKFIKMKDSVAEFIWYLLTGGLVTSVSYNYIVNTGCKQSVAEMQKRHTAYEKQVAEEQKAKADAPPARTYKSYE